jgi:hypothetical protein
MSGTARREGGVVTPPVSPLARAALASLLFFSLGSCAFKESEKDVETMAFIQCQDHVRKRLKAPSSADFPLLERSVTKTAENTYKVVSYVDAENSFGAKLRSSYVCIIKRTDPKGDKADPRSWRLVDLKIS